MKGKAFTPEQKEQAVQSLQSYLEAGFSRNKACAFIGLKPQTLSNWAKVDETLGMRLVSWENAVNRLAMANIHDAIRKEGEMDEDLKKENSWKWLERKESSFKPKQETEHSGELPTPILAYLDEVHTNDSNKESGDNETEDTSSAGGNLSQQNDINPPVSN